MTATVSTSREAGLLCHDASRPYVAMKPRPYCNRVIGRYTTRAAAVAAARRWNITHKETV